MRLAFNSALYFIFAAGMGAFIALRGPRSVGVWEVVLPVLVAALWSGGLTTLIETGVYRLPTRVGRGVLGGLLGALSLAGMAGMLGWIATGGADLTFIGVAALVGGVMQSVRAVVYGGRGNVDH